MTDEVFDPDVHASNPDGSPRLTAKGTYAKRRGPRPGFAASPTRKSTSTRKSATDYRPGINGLFQMVSVPLAFKVPADAAAVAHHGPGIAEALNELAKERPEVAAVLEKILSVGPYGLLISATLPLVLQILHNHDVIPEQMAVAVGVTPKRVIMDQLGQKQPEADDVPVAA